MAIPEFGEYHDLCVDRCACGVTWPLTVLRDPEALLAVCAGCARRATDALLLELGVPS